jgi:DsbE subfamily thiol:disulfide oxidoreductase
MMRAIPLGIFIALAALFAAVLLYPRAQDTADAFTDKPFPEIKLNSAEPGKQNFTSTQLRGHITLINFFASWCAPCMAEQPELRALKIQFPDLHIEGVVWNDDAKKLETSLKKSGNPYTNLWTDTNGDAAIALGIRGIPESFFVDRDGIVRYHLAGPLAPDLDRGTIIPLIEKMQKDAAHAN